MNMKKVKRIIYFLFLVALSLFLSGGDLWYAIQFILLFLFATGAFLFFKDIPKEAEELRKRKLEAEIKAEKEQQRQIRISFYNSCKERKILDFSSPANKQKAQLLAEQYGYSDGMDFEAFFALAESDAVAEARALEEHAMRVLRSKEEKEVCKLSKYESLFGREKRIKMLTDIRDECLTKIEEAEQTRKLLVSIAAGQQQKEHDWAVHGGIASGIAGGAAGLATAIDIQNKNAAIRSQNQAIINTYAGGVAKMHGSIVDYQKQAEAAKAEINEAKIKLVEETPAEDIWKMLDITTEKVEISKTGAFKVKAKLKVTSDAYPVKVFENQEGVIDGTIVANLYQNGAKVGEAFLCLPLYGVERSSEVEGIGTGEAKENIPYEIEYVAHKLWLMEK